MNCNRVVIAFNYTYVAASCENFTVVSRVPCQYLLKMKPLFHPGPLLNLLNGLKEAAVTAIDPSSSISFKDNINFV